MTDSVIKYLIKCRDEYTNFQEENGYSEFSIVRSNNVIDYFIEFYSKSIIDKGIKLDSFDIVDAFIKFRFKSRAKQLYNKRYINRKKRNIYKFFDYYSNESYCFEYKRDLIENEIEYYTNSLVFNHERTPIEIRNNITTFLNYLDLIEVQGKLKLNERLLNSYIEFSQDFFYKKRQGYSRGYEKILRSQINKYFKFLFNKGYSSFEKFINKPKYAKPTFLNMAIEEYLNFRREQENRSIATIYKARKILEQLDDYLIDKDIKKLKSIKLIHIDNFTKEFFGKRNLQYIHEVNSILRKFFNFLYFTDQIPVNPTKYITAAPIYRLSNVPKSLPVESLEAIIKNIDVKTHEGIRKYAMFSLVLLAGLRVGEVAGLTLDDISWEEKRIHIRNRKNGHDLVTVLSDDTLSALKNYILKVRPKSNKYRNIFFSTRAPLIPLRSKAISAIFRRELKKHNISGGAHRIRHSFAQNLLESGSSLSEVQMLMGHKSIESSRIYTKSSLIRMRKFIIDDEI